jgi:ribosomal protein S18 acetylase RimI-like enzyme
MATTIRLATGDDVPMLVALMREFYAEGGYPLPGAAATHAFHALLAEPRLGAVWLAEDSTTVVGYIVLTLGFSMNYGALRGCIDDLYVQPSARGRAIGAALLATLRAACVARGVKELWVEVGAENGAARRLYERAGYTDTGHLLLSLPLAPPMHAADLPLP